MQDTGHHMLGQFAASIIAKELFNVQRVVVVRCEEICLSGLVRQKLKYLWFLRKMMNTKPSHGLIHLCAPAKILWKTIRLFEEGFPITRLRGEQLRLLD
ncbi:60S ribosomal protein L13a [Thalictrum thalictroides]|uniref:60S ribosomal protein L13a n=1 Tax=Thalictrum thalictroides TaxID=46969 RepID=A0A7J6WVS4_THATH|nr:60S ribosomal protein L13a [Thalictrum thalictroides]